MDFRHLRTFIGEHITFLKKKTLQGNQNVTSLFSMTFVCEQ